MIQESNPVLVPEIDIREASVRYIHRDGVDRHTELSFPGESIECIDRE